jgi:2-polyprenyl-6-methoxyphenol hydroxylase-like FAD-dependent oxidoreductase
MFEQASTPVRQLPTPAMCMSRFSLDALLAEEFQQLGGELRAGERWRETNVGEGVVRASGRQAQPQEGGWRWFGLKVHARNISLAADLEMHARRDGYVGLSRLPGGEVNVCGLFRAGAHPGSVWSGRQKPNDGTELELRAPREKGETRGWLRLLCGEPTSRLQSRLEEAVFDEDSFCSVAGLSFRPQRAAGRTDCCIGDALTMTPPATGNGMSMAFEGAELALSPLTAWSRNEISWPDAQEVVARACDSAFGRRLSWARWLQWMMFTPAMQTWFGAVPLHSEWLWQTMFARTR